MENKKVLEIFFGIAVVMAIIGAAVWYFFLRDSTGGGGTSTCGSTTYDPTKQTCIKQKLCDNDNVCGSGSSQTCIDPNSQKCVNNVSCALTAVCKDSNGKEICMDPKTQVCVADGTVCDNDNACGSGKSLVCLDPTRQKCIAGQPCNLGQICANTNCCDDNQKCSAGGICVTCDTDLCGKTNCCTDKQQCMNDECCDECGNTGKCCDSGEECITLADGSYSCCKTDNICLDTNGNKICCGEGQVCHGNVCCDADKACDDGECCGTQCCGETGKTECCGSGTTCHNNSCMTACGTTYCDPTTQVCDSVLATGDKYCVNTGCEWSGIVYDPSDMRNTTGVADIDVCGASGNYYTCNDPSGVSPSDLQRTVTDVQSSSSQQDCGIGDCNYRFAENALIDVAWNSANKTCTGTFDCIKKLPKCGDCPFTDDADKNRCCMSSDGSTYTGQICPQDMFCDNGKCYAGYKCAVSDSGFGTCEATTSQSDAKYFTLQQCYDAGCISKPPECYTQSILDIANKTKMTAANFIWVAIYGVDEVSCTDHSNYVNWEGRQGTGWQPWLGVWKGTKSGYSRHLYVCVKNKYNQKKYFLDIYIGKDGDIKTGTLIGAYENACNGGCAGPPTSETDLSSDWVLDFTEAHSVASTGSGTNSPAVLVLVPSANIGKNSCDTTTSFYGITSGNSHSAAMTRWNPAGVF
jgi:hypothetical protein